MANFRCPQILRLARDIPCCLCGAQNGTTVAAHANWQAFGKGKSIKAHDWAVAYLCMGCHDIVDGRAGGLLRHEQQDEWSIGWAATVKLWKIWSAAPDQRGKVADHALNAIDGDLFERFVGVPLAEALA